MNRKFKFAFVILLILLASSGCLRMEAEVDLEMDGSGYLQYDLGVDNTLYRLLQLEGSTVVQLEETARNRNYSVENYQDDEFSGLLLAKDFADLEELSQELALFFLLSSDRFQQELEERGDELEDLENLEELEELEEKELIDEIIAEQEERLDFTIEDGLFIRHFRVDYNLDLRQADIELPEQFSLFISDILYDRFEIGLTLNLPFRPLDHNAEPAEEDARSLRWDFNFGEENQIFVEGRVLIWENIITAGIAVLVLVLIIIFQVKARGSGST